MLADKATEAALLLNFSGYFGSFIFFLLIFFFFFCRPIVSYNF